ncbi:carbohydrate kinase family protein [Paenibacillus riograndensis]|uniref:Fructokinase n=4 Tax=Paenibacillus riograndensis TaxID=483937 RepID=A0A132TG66_9BACL|nr:carbohydrate kinase [Paenibacillus riograndensis]KWX70302.1 fructokinase [Paenibacillus riograndensis]CQR53951.1 fructokinase [Paenibacillus riograndensis SBR5]
MVFKLDERIKLPADREYDVLSAGEMLVDFISEEDQNTAGQGTYHPFFGGAPSNIAMNISRLGIRPIVASAVGNDRLGFFLVESLKKAGIDTKCVQIVEDSTSLVLITKSTSTPVPIFYRAADYQLAYTPELEQAVLKAGFVHFSCWPISMEPSRQTINRVIEAAKRRGIPVCFDPNYHPQVWRKGEDGTAYVKKIISQADIVKPSEDDAERLFGRDTPENQVQKYIALGAGLVIMTLGKDGAIVSNGQETARFETLAHEVVDTTGAGDAFWSGFYTALVRGATVREALRSGFAVSAFKLKYTGAVVPLPDLNIIQAEYGC